MNPSQIFVHHIGITAPAAVLDQVADFYDIALGLKPGYRPEFFGLGGKWLYSGDLPIVHLLEDEARDGSKSGYFDHFALRCHDYDGVVARLSQHNIEYSEIDSPDVQQRQVFITDPAGNSVELNFDVSQ